MTVFHEKLRIWRERLERTGSVGKILRALTFRVITLDERVAALESEVYQRHKDLEEYLLATQEYEDMKLYLHFCELRGTGIASAEPQSAVTTKRVEYGPDWSDISVRVRERDGFVCQEADRRCRGPLQAHHIISLSHGGTNTDDNLVTLCEYHHSLKHPHMK